MNRENTPEINAGSMADIAFLLLIFFLVTTTLQVDSGIQRKLPEKQAINNPIVIKDRNYLEININANNQLFIGETIIPIENLRALVLDFIDNGGGFDSKNKPCDWCNGNRSPKLSDHPTKAFITIKPARETAYKTYINVLDIINSVYMQLRNQLALNQFNTSYANLESQLKTTENEQETVEKIEFIRERYPILISDL